MYPLFYLKLIASAESPRRPFHSAPKPIVHDPSLPMIHARPYLSRKKSRLPKPLSSPARWFFLYAGAIVPLVCLVTAVFHPADAAWQSGHLRDYAYSLFQGTALLAFSPLMLFSTVCFCLLLYDEPKMVRHQIVRFGIYAGAFLSINFVGLYLWGYTGFHFENLLLLLWVGGISALFVITLSIVPFILYLGFSSFRGVLYGRSSHKSTRAEEILSEIRHPHRGRFIALSLLVAVVLLAGAAATWDQSGDDFWSYILFPWVLTCLLGPFCTLTGYGVMVRRMWGYQTHPFRFSLAWLFLVVIWFALFMTAWRYAAGQMLEFYRQLPIEPM